MVARESSVHDRCPVMLLSQLFAWEVVARAVEGAMYDAMEDAKQDVVAIAAGGALLGVKVGEGACAAIDVIACVQTVAAAAGRTRKVMPPVVEVDDHLEDQECPHREAPPNA
jgi:hypothetical protein